ncbi:MAG TPA: class I SAM-dependent methyltransferase [Geobacteraceae bacterium]
MNCRICDAKMDLFGTYEKSAIEVAKLYPQPTAVTGVDISLYGCSVCGHYQIPYVNTESYYDEYVMTVSHSPKIQSLQSDQANKLFSYAVSRDHFIEIGCGDGSFLTHVRPLFTHVLGVEPSRPYYDLAIKRDLNVINEYLTENLTFDHTFDAFASRQVFEHVSNPVQILQIVRNIMGDDAVGLIEVPNAQKMLSENRYFDLFSDHINYFTPLSLCYLARKVDLEVVSIQESFNRDYLELYVRKKQRVLTLAAKRESDFAFLKDAASKYKNISAWGAGSKAQAIMTALGNELKLKHIFDSDPYKDGKYLVNCSTQVVKPSQEKIMVNDLIVIFAVSYQDEIINSLKKEYGYSGDILCLEGVKPCISRI